MKPEQNGYSERREKVDNPLVLRVALFDSPWESTLEPSHPLYPEAVDVYRLQDTRSAIDHEAFWLLWLRRGWPRRRGGRSAHETLGHVRQGWGKREVTDGRLHIGVTNRDAARAMWRTEGSMSRIIESMKTLAERQRLTQAAMVDALGDGIDDPVTNENEESVKWRLPRLVTADDPGLVSGRGESISMRSLTPKELAGHNETQRQAVAAQYRLAEGPDYITHLTKEEWEALPEGTSGQ